MINLEDALLTIATENSHRQAFALDVRFNGNSSSGSPGVQSKDLSEMPQPIDQL